MRLFVSLSLSLAFLGSTFVQPAHAQWWKRLLDDANSQPAQQYVQPGLPVVQQQQCNLSPASNSLKNVERSADQLLAGIQMRAVSSPGTNFAPLVVSLNALKDCARQARRAADSNNFNNLMSRISQLQIISGNALTVAQTQPGLGDTFTIAQLQIIQSNIQQALTFASAAPPVVPINPYTPYNPYNPNPYNPYTPPNPYNPTPYYTPGIVQASANGRGSFTMMGQNLLAIKSATLACADPIGRRATFTMTQGNATINLLGTLISQTPTTATITINNSDRGTATGTITTTLTPNGTLNSANGNGTLNGQPFVVSFRGN